MVSVVLAMVLALSGQSRLDGLQKAALAAHAEAHKPVEDAYKTTRFMAIRFVGDELTKEEDDFVKSVCPAPPVRAKPSIPVVATPKPQKPKPIQLLAPPTSYLYQLQQPYYYIQPMAPAAGCTSYG